MSRRHMLRGGRIGGGIELVAAIALLATEGGRRDEHRRMNWRLQ